MRLQLILLLFIAIACKEPERHSFDAARVKVEIQQMMEDYHQAIKERGFIAELEYLDDSEEFFWVPPGYTSALSYDSVRTILEATAKSIRSAAFHWETLQIIPLNDSIATYSGIVNGSTVDTAGHVNEMAVIESGTLILRSDGWKLLCGQTALLSQDNSRTKE